MRSSRGRKRQECETARVRMASVPAREINSDSALGGCRGARLRRGRSPATAAGVARDFFFDLLTGFAQAGGVSRASQQVRDFLER